MAALALAAGVGIAGGEYVAAADITVSSGTINSGTDLGSAYSEATMEVQNAGAAVDTSIYLGGSQDVLAGGYASQTAIFNSGEQIIQVGGYAVETNISSGGSQNVYGSAQSTTIFSNGVQYVDAGWTQSTTISSGGIQNINAGGRVYDTTVSGGGWQYVHGAGATADTTVVHSGGSQQVEYSAIVWNTTVSSGGLQLLAQSGSAMGATLDGGVQTVVTGLASGTTVDGGGELYQSAGGRVSGLNMVSGTHYLEGASFSNYTYSSGNTQVVRSGGTASGITLDGGVQIVADGVARQTSIGAGGILWSDSGGSVVDIAGPVSGQLQGYGTVYGSVQIANGGTLAAGGAYDSSSITGYGSMAVSGDLTVDSGGVYTVRVESGGSGADSVQVTGSATVSGATFSHVAAAGAVGDNYAGGSWQVLSAGGGVDGAFATATTTLAFYNAVLDYSANDVTLGFKRSLQFDDYADTYNRTGVANGLISLESLDPGNALVQAILGLDAAAVPALYNQLSGEMHASLAGGLQLLDRDFSRFILNRAGRRSLARTILAPAAQSFAGADGYASIHPRTLESRFANSFWVDLGYARQSVDGDGNAGRYTLKGPEVSLGYDYIAPSGWLGGVSFRYGDRDMKVKGRLSEADIDSYSIAAHGGFQTAFGPGLARLVLGGVYTRHEVDGKRRVAALGQQLKSDYHANSYQLFMEGAYAIPLGNAVLEPFVDVAWSSMRTPGFTEKGGTAAIRSHSATRNNLSQFMGLRLVLPVVCRVGVEAQAGWRHTYGRLNKASDFSFVAGGDRFGIKGSRVNRNEAVLDLRAEYEIRDNLRVGLEAGVAVGERGNNARGGGFIALEW